MVVEQTVDAHHPYSIVLPHSRAQVSGMRVAVVRQAFVAHHSRKHVRQSTMLTLPRKKTTGVLRRPRVLGLVSSWILSSEHFGLCVRLANGKDGREGR